MNCVITLLTDKTELDEAVKWIDDNGNLADDAKSLSEVLPLKRRKLPPTRMIDVNDEVTEKRHKKNT